MPVHNSFTLLLAESKVEGLFHNQKNPAHFKVCTVSVIALVVDDSVCNESELLGQCVAWGLVWYKHLNVDVMVLVLNNSASIMPVRLA